MNYFRLSLSLLVLGLLFSESSVAGGRWLWETNCGNVFKYSTWEEAKASYCESCNPWRADGATWVQTSCYVYTEPHYVSGAEIWTSFHKTGYFVGSNGSQSPSGAGETDSVVGRYFLDQPEVCQVTGNHPVVFARGEKRYDFRDVEMADGDEMAFSRSYRVRVGKQSGGGATIIAGWNWSFLDKKLIKKNAVINVIRGDGGGAFSFSYNSATDLWMNTDKGFVSRLEVIMDNGNTQTGWRFSNSSGVVEEYNMDGNLVKITNSNGVSRLITYGSYNSAPRMLVEDERTGRALHITYGEFWQPTSVVSLSNKNESPAGKPAVNYRWEADGRLQAVIYPDDSVQLYRYEPEYNEAYETSNGLITGIYELNVAEYDAWLQGGALPPLKRYSKVTYDSLGRVKSSALWNADSGVETERLLFAYKQIDGATEWNWNSHVKDTKTIVTNMKGIVAEYTFHTDAYLDAATTTNDWRLTAVTGSADGVTGCAATSASTTYSTSADPEGAGFLKVTTDNNAINTAIVRKTQRLRDSHGRITTLSTGLDNNLNTTTDSQKVTTSYWDNTTNLPASKNYYGYKTGENDYRQEVFTYYSGNNRIATRTAKDLSGQGYLDRNWTYHYSPTDSSVNIEQMTVTDPRGYITTYNYSNGQLTSITKPSVNGVTQIIQYDNYNSFGLPQTVTEMPNNVVTTLVYDVRGRLIDSTTSGAHTHIDYWPNGLVKKVTSPDFSWLQYDYNSAHQLTRISNQAGEHIEYNADPTNYPLNPINGKWQQAVTYDGNGNVKLQQHRLFDALGRLWKQQDANGTDKTIFNYDANDNLQFVIALGDINSATPATYDANNHTSKRLYDGQNRVTDVYYCADDGTPTVPYSCATQQARTQYSYDDQGNVATVTDANGHITQYTYNGFGELVREESPDRGTTTYEYDLAGNLSKKTKAPDDVDEDGAGPDKDDTLEITYGWDALNRLISINYPGTAQDITYVYDEANHGAGVGRLTHVVDANGTTNYFYNAFGNVTKKVETPPGLPAAQTTQYGYNSANELESITYPSGQVVQVTRETGRISALTSGGADFISNVLYQPFGGITGWNTNSNDLINQYIRNYDANGHLAQYGVGATSQNATAMYTLQYDAYGSISALLDPDNLVKEAYGYDAQNRLTSVSAEYGDISYGYDAVGNRTGKVFNRFDPASNAIQEFYTEAYGIDPNSNRINSITRKVGGSTVRTRSFDYDARGNIKTDTRQKTGEAAKSYPLIYGDSDRLNSITAP